MQQKFTITTSELSSFLRVLFVCHSRVQLQSSCSGWEWTIATLRICLVLRACYSLSWTAQTHPEKVTAYRSIVALANFINCWTRPALSFVVNKLCKFMSNPGETHIAALKHLMRYLKGTQEAGLMFDCASQPHLYAYTDASHGDCRDTGRSTMGYAFFYGHALLSWHSKLYSSVTTSTNHSEYTAMALATKEAQWQKWLCEAFTNREVLEPIPIYVDNAGTVALAMNPLEHSSNKHIMITCHFVRENVRNLVTPTCSFVGQRCGCFHKGFTSAAL